MMQRDNVAASTRAYRYTGTSGFLAESFTATFAPPPVALGSLAGKSRLRILFFTKRPEYFDLSDLRDGDNPLIETVLSCTSEDELAACDGHFDLAIVCNSLMGEHVAHLLIRQRKLADLIVAWTFDNHHHLDSNRSMVEFSDLVLAAHAFAEDTFHSGRILLGRPFPVPTGQWSRDLAQRHINLSDRSDKMFGGYVAWPVGPRNDQVRKIQSLYPDAAVRLIDPDEREVYFGQSPEERFREWNAYKSHLVLPLGRDIPARFFDSLLCGQIPVVPYDCPDLNRMLSQEIQDHLPILRFDETDDTSLLAAHRTAIECFDSGGAEGILRRRDYAMKNHHVAARIGQIATYLRSAAEGGCRSTIVCDDRQAKWTLDDPADAGI